MRKRTLRTAAVAAVAIGAFLAPSPAHAVSLEWSVNVNPSDLSATARVYDSFGGSIAATLTAVATVTCGVVSPQSTITASDQGIGNPVYLSTPGTCRPYNGEATYDLTWTSIGGTSGHHTVVCVIRLGVVTCSLPGMSVRA